MTLCVCSGGDEGGGDWEMSQRHQEAPRGDGLQKQQVTATTEAQWSLNLSGLSLAQSGAQRRGSY